MIRAGHQFVVFPATEMPGEFGRGPQSLFLCETVREQAFSRPDSGVVGGASVGTVHTVVGPSTREAARGWRFLLRRSF